MTTLSIQPPYPIITDIDGQPLEDGYIWIGVANLPPIGNPIAVYWDAALTQPAALPVRTRGGYPVNAGTPARLYVGSDYSILVQNKNGSTVYSAPSATERYGNIISFADITGTLGSDRVTFLQAGSGAVTRTAQSKMREWVSVKDFGAVGDGVTDDTAAIHAAMTYLMDRFAGNANFYPGGPGDPTDFYARDRRTGRIYFPSGAYRVQPNVFSSLSNARAPYVGFEFFGDHRYSSVLLLTTNGIESWFYNNGSGQAKYQALLFRSLGFRSDDYRYGNVAKMWSDGGPKQFRFEHCDFQYLQRLLYTWGTGNADLTKVVCCTGQFFGDILTLNNNQSVQHDFIGSDLGTYANFVHVEAAGGGNVNIINGSIDFIWHTDYSPAGGNWMFLMDSGANVAQGNATFAYRDLRIEVEAYTRGAGDPPFGLINSYGNPQSAIPRLLFENVNFVNGLTYTIDGNGNITGSSYRRITAVQLYPRQNAEFKNCVLLKTFFYNIGGNNTSTSPNAGAILKFTDCFDGIIGELPPADSALVNLHDRVTYGSTAGRVITQGMTEHTTGSPFTRKVLDADPRWRNQFAREEASTVKIVSFKAFDEGWPQPSNSTYDHYIDLPPNLVGLRIYINKPASGASTNSYTLYFGTADKSIVYATSTPAQFKDAHTIDISHISFSPYTQLRIWAVGAGSDFQSGGTAYIQYV